MVNSRLKNFDVLKAIVLHFHICFPVVVQITELTLKKKSAYLKLTATVSVPSIHLPAKQL